ncbi:hypothetical protein HZY91_07785 [Facklamia sp. DSM 111018]|uniref:Acyl-ACP thioesterase n=1 Tax=Facklamia lactis TaxID=2749967 RepID=A0ABS0LRJ6_9LACT|nr:acyl-ACP thioesterase domain-containing protein [Facklamia lactis]MBG9980840.1 hypothetical protein [Facklamia lactis]MBG9986797.1 hypothetical protein [Facklamia lactis]
MEHLAKIKQYKAFYIITQEYFLSDIDNKFDFSRLMKDVLQTSGEHDCLVNKFLDQPILTAPLSWIITQNHFKVYRLPKMGDRIEIETRLVNANRFFVDRWFSVRSKEDLLMEFQIQFSVINLKTRKMGRIPDSRIKALDLVDSSQYQRMEKISLPEEMTIYSDRGYQIQDEDIDGNNHVNNLVYLRWCLQALPFDLLREYQVESLGIKYGHELLFDQEVSIQTYLFHSLLDQNGEFRIEPSVKVCSSYQIIQNLSTDREAGFLIINWKRNESLS